MPSHEVARLLRNEGDRVSCHEAPSSPTDVSVRWSSSALSKEGEVDSDGDRRPAIGDACSIMPASVGRPTLSSCFSQVRPPTPQKLASETLQVEIHNSYVMTPPPQQ
jgi:hypothetical protein